MAGRPRQTLRASDHSPPGDGSHAVACHCIAEPNSNPWFLQAGGNRGPNSGASLYLRIVGEWIALKELHTRATNLIFPRQADSR